MKSIVEKSTQMIPKALLQEQEASSAARKQIIEAGQELDKIIWSKDGFDIDKLKNLSFKNW